MGSGPIRIFLIPALTLGMAVTLGAPLAGATTMVPHSFVCPVGGEKFESEVIASYSSFGSRPDGRSYGTLPIMPMTECPGNGFVLIGEKYSKAEIAALEAVVASAEYQAMRQAETPHFRAWHLMKAIGRPPEDLAGTLLEASWETDEDPVRKARYQRLFVAAADVLVRKGGKGADREWFFLNLRAANAQRELGDFAGATARLTTLSQNLDLAGYGPDEVDEKAGLTGFVQKLGVLAAEGNAWFEPASLVPGYVAVQRCEMKEPALTASERTICDSSEVVEARKEMRRAEAENDGT